MRGHLGKIIIYSNTQPIYFGLFGDCFYSWGGNTFPKPTCKFRLEKVSIQVRKNGQRKLPTLSWAGSSKFKPPQSPWHVCPAGHSRPSVRSGTDGRGGCCRFWLHHLWKFTCGETCSAPIGLSLIDAECQARGRGRAFPRPEGKRGGASLIRQHRGWEITAAVISKEARTFASLFPVTV